MNQRKSWLRREILLIAGVMGMLSLAPASATPGDQPIGLVFDWNSTGTDVYVVWIRTQGGSNEREFGMYVSKTSSKHLSYMPGDVNGIPEWMEVEWLYNLQEGTYEETFAQAKPSKVRLDLKTLIPQADVDEVRRDSGRKVLKLIFTVNDDKLDFRHKVEQWRD
jgi:hypothetical protein